MPVGKVIKQGDMSQDVQSADRQPIRGARPAVVRSEDYEAGKNAADVIADAKRQYDQILAEAEVQKQKIFDDAQERGRQQGLAMVTEQLARAKIQAGELLAQHEQDVIQLACKIAEKIIGRDLERDPQTLVELCATAVENVRNAKSLVLRVNPEMASRLRERKKDLMDLIGRSVDVAIKEDADVATGGCIVQTEFGTIDAQLFTQLEMIQRVLLDDGKKDGPA